ncbi:MAG: dephospho-CoA kinase [Saprospiraceae bacterium]|nr:dephospho-CoA kinase [Saprospiraceae bacterium]
MIQVGLTGGIGSGKSTVAEIFKTLGIPIYNSDKEAKKLIQNSPKLRNSIIELLGEESYTNEELNRKFIAKKVFQNEKLLKQLNAIVHPEVFQDYEKWIHTIDKNIPYVIKESALLLDVQKHQAVDHIVLVFTPLLLRIKRIMARDKISHEEVVNRMKNQKSDKEFLEASDYVIVNDELHPLIPQVLEIHKVLTSL